MAGKPSQRPSMARAAALLVLAVALLIPICGAKDKAVPEQSENLLKTYPMRFAILGDRTGDHVPGVFGQIVQEVERLKPDFVVNVGDMIEGYTEDEAKLEEQWLEFKGLIEPLSMPIYLMPGNHDISSDGMVDQYKKHIGEPDYSFDVRGVHFVMLDTGRYESPDELRDDQYDWLKKDLAEHKEACYTIAILHKPFWIETIAKGKPDKLHDLFVANGVDAVFTGHYHYYFAGEYDGIKYTSVGSSGGGTEEDAAGLLYHFVWATFDGKELSLAPIKMDAVLGWDRMTGDDFLFIGNMQGKAVVMDKAPVREDLTVPKTKVSMKIVNLCDKAPIEDVLEWKVPVGWEVKPAGMQVKVAPSGSLDAEFTVRCKGDLYPVPSFTLKCPYREGKTAKIEQNLAVFRTAEARRAETSPVIDGELGEKAWGKPTTTFFRPDSIKTECEPAAFYFAYDKDNLYLAARCTESEMNELQAKVKEHDGPIYGEDCVGYFIQTAKDAPVYQIYFNASGVAFDQKITIEEQGDWDADKAWNGDYEVKAVRGDGYWSVEARVPLAQLGAQGVAGKTFALNFRRKQARLRSAADWQTPISYLPESFGVLELK